ncbi:hypothetical protein BD310DRAFT_601332 [Dichomitus squalens]|uniref:Uncharacterized protein n=1 Tax=Dichomitus squalens TaxID=114155 RepID=A0A4Q9PQV3_9APHY|nr:hypothetical protein BD310DRAFT_601332 [Dichomitus squalens]
MFQESSEIATLCASHPRPSNPLFEYDLVPALDEDTSSESTRAHAAGLPHIPILPHPEPLQALHSAPNLLAPHRLNAPASTTAAALLRTNRWKCPALLARPAQSSRAAYNAAD